MVRLHIYFGMFSLFLKILNYLYSYISLIRGQPFDFWEGWRLEDSEKIFCSLPSKEKMLMHGQLWEKTNHVCITEGAIFWFIKWIVNILWKPLPRFFLVAGHTFDVADQQARVTEGNSVIIYHVSLREEMLFIQSKWKGPYTKGCQLFSCESLSHILHAGFTVFYGSMKTVGHHQKGTEEARLPSSPVTWRQNRGSKVWQIFIYHSTWCFGHRL